MSLAANYQFVIIWGHSIWHQGSLHKKSAVPLALMLGQWTARNAVKIFCCLAEQFLRRLWGNQWVVWVQVLPVWRHSGQIAKFDGPRIFPSEGREDVENTGFEGEIAFSLSIVGPSDRT